MTSTSTSVSIEKEKCTENDRQNLLDRLLDAVKQCQVRFGGKSELATDGDSRVSCLCTQWEAIFQHGLKKPRKGNAIMQVTGLSKPEPDPVMWMFLKEHLNALELERFAMLKNIQTDAGKGRAWLRSTLNEHTLEKYIHSFLGDENLLRLFYEKEAFLLDGERSSMLAMMAAGLSSILFAINIDNEELNTVKQAATVPSANKTLSNLWSQYIPNQQPKTDLPSPVLSTSIEEIFKPAAKTKKKRRKKVSANIVPIDDGDDSFPVSAASCDDIHSLSTVDMDLSGTKKNKPFVKGHTRSSSLPVWKTSGLFNNDADFSSENGGEASYEQAKTSPSDNALSNQSKEKDNFYMNTSSTADVPLSENERKENVESKNFYFSIPKSSESTSADQGRETLSCQSNNLPMDIYSSNLNLQETSDTDSGNNEVLHPLDSTQGTLTPLKPESAGKTEPKNCSEETVSEKDLEVETHDNTSISSALSGGDENSFNFPPTTNESGEEEAVSVSDVTQQALAACSDVQRGMDQFTNFASITRTLGDGRDTPEQQSSYQDGMSAAELKQAIVSMMLRKDEVEEENRCLKVKVEETMETMTSLQAELTGARKEMGLREGRDSTRIQNLSRENELLKHQLKKYVGAVQLLRRDLQGHQSQDTDQALSGIRYEEPLPAIPEKRPTEEISDFSLSKEYERKLIQVAEMHGELMEFNERLQRLLNLREVKVRRLTEELIHLRGPLPEDNEEHSDLLGSDLEDSLSLPHSRPLINVWIPSAFIQGKSSSFHHVYQVYVRIRDDEWNIYRRYSQFHEMHKKLKSKYPAVNTFKFPPKKTIGNRDTKFVEERRRLLQDYLRLAVNLLVTAGGEALAGSVTKETFVQSVPFFKDPYPPEKTKKSGSSTQRGNTSQPRYTGL